MIEPNLRRATRLLMDLLTIPGKSCEEAAVSQFVQDQLVQAGIAAGSIKIDSAHRRTPSPGQTGNLIYRTRGTRRAPRRMFSAHLDTVPLCVGARPRRQNRMIRSADPHTGLGADNRAGVAVVLNTALEIFEQQPAHPPLTFVWFVQEEIGLQGARCVTQSLLQKPAEAYNWDGGSPLKLTIGATSGYRMEIRIEGLASHAGGAPQWGVSAVTIAGLAIADLQRGGWLGDIRKRSKRGTSNIGFIHGGEATNVVTDRVTLRAEARSHDPDFRKQIVAQFERAFTVAATQVQNAAGVTGSVQIEGRLDYESYCLDKEEPCVAAAAEVIEQMGKPFQYAIANGGLDANWTNRHGIPTVSLGCGQLNQHTVEEALDLDGFEDACRIALRLATRDA